MLLEGLEGELTTAAGQFAGDAEQERLHGLHFPTPQLLVAAQQRHPADQVVGQDRALEQRGVRPRSCATVSLHNSRNANFHSQVRLFQPFLARWRKSIAGSGRHTTSTRARNSSAAASPSQPGSNAGPWRDTSSRGSCWSLPATRSANRQCLEDDSCLSTTGAAVETYRHDDRRTNIPPAKIAAEGQVPLIPKARRSRSSTGGAGSRPIPSPCTSTSGSAPRRS